MRLIVVARVPQRLKSKDQHLWEIFSIYRAFLQPLNTKKNHPKNIDFSLLGQTVQCLAKLCFFQILAYGETLKCDGHEEYALPSIYTTADGKYTV